MIINIGQQITCEEQSEKVRLSSIKDNKILFCNYNGFWMLPGGKIESGETKKVALTREIKEELGHDLKDAFAFVTINNYAKNYKSRTTKKNINKKITTTYYKTDEAINLNPQDRNLSENEKEDIFEIDYIDIDSFINYIDSEQLDYKKQVYAKEVLTLINYYLKEDVLDNQHRQKEAIKKVIRALNQVF